MAGVGFTAADAQRLFMLPDRLVRQGLDFTLPDRPDFPVRSLLLFSPEMLPVFRKSKGDSDKWRQVALATAGVFKALLTLEAALIAVGRPPPVQQEPAPARYPVYPPLQGPQREAAPGQGAHLALVPVRRRPPPLAHASGPETDHPPARVPPVWQAIGDFLKPVFADAWQHASFVRQIYAAIGHALYPWSLRLLVLGILYGGLVGMAFLLAQPWAAAKVFCAVGAALPAYLLQYTQAFLAAVAQEALPPQLAAFFAPPSHCHYDGRGFFAATPKHQGRSNSGAQEPTYPPPAMPNPTLAATCLAVAYWVVGRGGQQAAPHA